MLVTRISEELGLKKPQPSITTGNKDARKKNGNEPIGYCKGSWDTDSGSNGEVDSLEGRDFSGNPEDGLTPMGKARVHRKGP